MTSRLKSMAAAAAMILIASIPTQATPSTLIWIPSTDIQPAGIPHIGHDVYAGQDSEPVHDFGLTFGTDRFEYGFDYLQMPGDSAGLWLNAKLQLLEEGKARPKLVIGAYNVGKREDLAPNFIYLLASKTTRTARFHAGLCMGRRSILGVDETHVLLGVDRTLGSKWWAGIDYQGGRSSFGALNIGVAYCFSSAASLIVGRDFYNESTFQDTWTVQLDVNL